MDPYRPEPVRCPRCGSTNSPTSAFCATCGLRSAQPPRGPGAEPAAPTTTSRRWIVIGLAVVVAAIAVGAGFAMLTRPGANQVAAATNSPSATASASVPAPSPSAAAATPTPVPTPVPNPILANRAIADVVVDELNVRESGSSSATVIGQLRGGARVFIIGAPVAEGDMNWYRVAVVSGDLAGYEPCTWWGCMTGIGFVATPISADPFLEEAKIGCPASPITVAELSTLTSLEQLHCYGNGDIVVTGSIDEPCCGYVGPIAYGPAWLATPWNTAYFTEIANTPLQFRIDPATGLAGPRRGDTVKATGHFDDPASPGCRATATDDAVEQGFDVSEMPTQAEIVLYCRTQMVFESFEVTDHKDLPPQG